MAPTPSVVVDASSLHHTNGGLSKQSVNGVGGAMSLVI